MSNTRNKNALFSIVAVAGLAATASASCGVWSTNRSTDVTTVVTIPTGFSANCTFSQARAVVVGFALRTGDILSGCWCSSNCFTTAVPTFGNVLADTETDATNCSSSAYAEGIADLGIGNVYFFGSASASTGLGAQAVVRTASTTYEEAFRDQGMSGGAAVSGADLTYTLSSPRGEARASTTSTATVTGTITHTDDPSNPNPNDFVDGRRFQLYLTGPGGASAYVIETPNGESTHNATLNGMGNYDVSFTYTITGGSVSLSPISTAADDGEWDLSEDGRLNEPDADALVAEIGTSVLDPVTMLPDQSNPLVNYDLNSSGAIDADDVDILRTIATSGVGAGVFADADGDGDVDCADRAFAPASPWNETIGGTGYVVEFDVDLDGDLDATDEDAFNRRFGDFAAPIGIYDLDDVDAFIAAFLAGDPLADLVVPFGVVDLDDSDAFNAAWLAACP